MVLATATTIDAPTEPDGHFPFTGLNAILFSVFLMSPVIAFFTSLIFSGWVQFRLGNDCSRLVRGKFAFTAGFIAPIIAYFGVSLLMLFSDAMGEIVNWIFPFVLLALYLAVGEYVVTFSARQTDPESPDNNRMNRSRRQRGN